MIFQNFNPKTNPRSNERDAGVKKPLIISSIIGGLFGIVFSVVAYFFWQPLRFGPGFLLVIPVICAVIAGLSGVAGTYLDKFFLKRGMTSPAMRRIASFVTVGFGSALIAVIIASVAGYVKFRQPIIWGITTGCTLGIIVSLVDYRLWKVRQKILTLEMENRFLSEIAKKDRLLDEATKNLIVMEERNKIARELHDSISQGIHGMIYSLHSLRLALSSAPLDPKVASILEHLDRTAQTTMDELRAMIMELKPSILRDRGLGEALRLVCDLFSQRYGITVRTSIQDILGLSPEQEVAIYRIAQEALTNVQKHSGAREVAVTLKAQDGDIVLSITDDGKGFDTEKVLKGNGLINMETRCRQNNGSFSVQSSPGKGTKITVVFTRIS